MERVDRFICGLIIYLARNKNRIGLYTLRPNEKLRLSIIGPDNEVLHSSSKSSYDKAGINLPPIDKLLVNKTLRVKFEISSRDEVADGDEESDGLLKNVLADTFGTLYRSGNLSDLSIVTKDGTMIVHKAVLGAHSPVFLKMLNSGMMEQSANKITISDYEATTVKRISIKEI